MRGILKIMPWRKRILEPRVRKPEDAAFVLHSRRQMIEAIRLMSMTILVMGLISTFALGVSLFMVWQKPEPVYFATRTGGELIPLVPLHEPHLGKEQILHFAVQAVTRANTYDFANYKQQLTEVRDYFTDEGYTAFVEALDASGNLKLVVGRRMVATAVANGGVIVQQGLSSSSRTESYMWRVQIPLNITYESSEESQVQELVVQLDIIRIPTWKNEWGVAVSRLISRSSR